jgi:hypothetical protein
VATTTADAICNRAITVIEALTPRSLDKRFRAYRNEGDADFEDFADKAAAGALRRFQVRTLPADEVPESSNNDVEIHFVNLVVIVAYPKDARYGRDQALDRDRVMDEDRHIIETAIGMRGAANFTPPNADATWRSEQEPQRERGRACDFLVLRQRMSYARNML